MITHLEANKYQIAIKLSKCFLLILHLFYPYKAFTDWLLYINHTLQKQRFISTY